MQLTVGSVTKRERMIEVKSSADCVEPQEPGGDG